MKEDFSFPRRQRICLKRDFDRIFAGRRSASDGNLVVYAVPNGLGYARLGLAVSRKHGNAVRRNRLKRLIREAFRLNKSRLPDSADMVVIPRKGLSESLGAIAESLASLAPKALGEKS